MKDFSSLLLLESTPKQKWLLTTCLIQNFMTFLTVENMFLAYNKAKKSRKSKREVYEWDYNFELNMRNFINDLVQKKYIHSEYKKIILTDSKKRYIHSPNFRDHIFHHLIYAEIYGVLNKQIKENKGKRSDILKLNFRQTINSYLWLIKWNSSYNLRKNILLKQVSAYFWNYFYVSWWYQKVVKKK